MAKIKIIQLTEQQRLQLEEGFRQGKSHAYSMRCRAVLLHRERQTKCEESEGGMAAGIWERSEREYLQVFFIRIGARYRRIRKRPKGKPTPQLYAYIPSERGLKLNIFGMIDRNNRYEGFSTTENMTADKVAVFFDRLSLRVRKNTFVVLDNASVHRCRLMKELRPIWEKHNGTYEGACSNTDGHGHTCGHGPEKHGLRKW